MPIHHNFTLKANGRLNNLTTAIHVARTILDEAERDSQILYETTALWDTGATNSCITAEVAAKIGAIPTGKVMVHGAHGAALTNTYIVDLGLPNKIGISQIKVTEVVSTVGGFGVIIGMDIITMGDFCITNYLGKTTFTYRYPSMKSIDFTDKKLSENKIQPTGSSYTPPKKKRK